MRNLVLIAFLTIQSCYVKYHGYVYDFDEEIPLENVRIYTVDSTDYVNSDKIGYFKLKKNKKVKYIIFKKENYRKFILSTLDRQHEFVKEAPFGDTIYLTSKTSEHVRPLITLPNNDCN
ncbi:MAG: hypothetical protein AAGI25_21155 [Bacteroidota bacterium]